jgi:hypothetical protein
MYRLCVDIAANYIRKHARERGLTLDIAELSHDSAIYVIEQYLKKPGFRVNRISAYMHFGCMKSLYRDKEWEQRKAPFDDRLLNEESIYVEEASPDTSGPFEGFPIGPRTAPQGSRHKPAIIKQGLLFEESDTGKDYEEILM